MSSRSMGTRRTRVVPGLALSLGCAVAGCQLGQHPFADEFAGNPPVTTASVEAARAVEATHLDQRRPYAETQVRAKDGAVTHGPLYYEDPLFEELDGDGRFAWAAVDYFYWVYGPACYLVDSVTFPVSAAFTPPWRAMESDGKAEHRSPTPGRHDASLMSACCPTPAPPPTSDSNSG